jgi:hypothetical protein
VVKEGIAPLERKTDKGSPVMLHFRIIYPRGDESLLSVAEVRDFEVNSWALASRKEFDDEDEAWQACYDLAKMHGLAVEDDRPDHHNFLD